MSKKIILTSATVLFLGFAGFAQGGRSAHPQFGPANYNDLGFEVRGRYDRQVKKEDLSNARFVSDVIAGYPEKWITSYVSVEIMATCNGRPVKAVSPDGALSAGQKEILNRVDLATDIDIHVRYIYKDPVTHDVENNEIHVSMTVIPYTEAEYAGGEAQMKKYLKENAIDKISAATPKRFRKGIVRFTVNEQGEVSHAQIFSTSGDPKTDQVLLNVIRHMPTWRPARNARGIPVKQDFEFSVGNVGC